MDRKTLEYMTNRAVQGQFLVSRIEELTQSAKRLEDATQIRFSDQFGNDRARLSTEAAHKHETHKRLVRAVRSMAIEQVNEEIRKLEAELAEL